MLPPVEMAAAGAAAAAGEAATDDADTWPAPMDFRLCWLMMSTMYGSLQKMHCCVRTVLAQAGTALSLDLPKLRTDPSCPFGL